MPKREDFVHGINRPKKLPNYPKFNALGNNGKFQPSRSKGKIILLIPQIKLGH